VSGERKLTYLSARPGRDADLAPGKIERRCRGHFRLHVARSIERELDPLRGLQVRLVAPTI
jgi:hypothetical protein